MNDSTDPVSSSDLEGDAEYFAWPRVSEEATRRVTEMVRQGITSYHLPTYEAFESDLGRLFGVRHALCCCNATTACYSAFRALGIGPGDTVIAPCITHWASVLPAVQCGARIDLADVQPGTCHIDPDAVRRLIDSSTRAVVVTHMFGLPLRLEELRKLCDAHGLALIEDVSHAHGARYQGRPVGSFGDVSFCSFQGAKLVSGGEGGALLTNRSDFYYRAMELGHPRRLQQAPPPWRSFAGVGRGFKFRPSALLIALAHESLRDLDEQSAIRRRAYDELREDLRSCQQLVALDRPPDGRAFFRYELYLNSGAGLDEESVVRVLLASGVRAQRLVGYLPGLPSLQGHLRREADWPVARDVIRRAFFLEAFTAYSRPVIQRHGQAIVDTLSRLAGAL